MSFSQAPKDQAANPDRRKLLKVAAKFSAIMATVGVSNFTLSDLAHAEEIGPLEQLLNHAIETGDMEEAISLYGKEANLLPEQLDALRSLSESDLQDLSVIREKLKLDDSYEFRTRRG